jgi:hypothetical protein
LVIAWSRREQDLLCAGDNFKQRENGEFSCSPHSHTKNKHTLACLNFKLILTLAYPAY